MTRLNHNLPAQVTNFIGRQEDIARLQAILAAPGPASRLVTLTGPGGTGKTRLALQVAGGLLEAFTDGVWWVELAALNEPGLIPQTISGTLGLPEQLGNSALAGLLEYLRGRRTLLILDNCEHLVAGCAMVCHALLSTNPETTILTTSRESLNIAGEINWPVSTLSLPEPEQNSETDLMHSEAVRLFVERAKTIQPGFEIAGEDWPLVGQLCHRLDGLPLAIELAAARINMLSISQLLSRLDNRFKLLTGGSRVTMPRHQTLQALVDWSYDLLTPAEQLVFRRLGIFVGGWSLEAAEKVCGWDELEPEEILDLQHRLVNKSLVVARNDTRPGRPPRYFLLETLRQYALKKLETSGELDRTRHQHFAYFLDLAEKSGPGLRGPQQVLWRERLELENDNLRSALGWLLNEPSDFQAAEPGDTELKLRLPLALFDYWSNKGFYEEWKKWLEKALAATALEPSSRLRALALYQAGFVSGFHFESEKSREYGRESLLLAQQFEDKYCEACALMLLGRFEGSQEGMATEENLAVLEQSLALFRELGAEWETAQVLGIIAETMCEMRTGGMENLERAIPLMTEALDILRRLGDGWRQAGTLISLTINYTTLGRFEEAHKFFELSKAQLERSGNTTASYTLFQLGIAARFQGYHREAVNYMRQSLEITRTWLDKPKVQIANVEGNLAFVEIELGRLQAAWNLLKSSLQLYQEINLLGGAAWCLEGFALLGLAAGLPELAARCFGAADHYRELAKAPMHHSDRLVYSPKIAALKKNLGAENLERLWNQGRATGLEEIIALAETGLSNLGPDRPAKPASVTEKEKPGLQPTEDRGALAGLTSRELEVLRLVARGLTNSQVAQELVLSTLTVNAYLRTIYSKLNVTSRTAATRLALDNHLV